MRIAAEITGILAIITSLLSFQMKKRGTIMAFQMTASLLSSLSLFLVGTVVGGCLDFLSFVRTLIFSNNDKKWASSPLWLAGFCLLMIATGILTWESAWSILPIIGSLLSTIALWMKKEKHIRMISFMSGPCWFVFNIFCGTFAGAVNEILAMSSIVIGLIRHDRKKTEVISEPVK